MAGKKNGTLLKKMTADYGKFDRSIVIQNDSVEDTFEIKVRSGLTMSDFGNAIIDIAQACFVDDPVNGKSYAPYLVEFAHAMGVIKYYTDLKLDIDQETLWRVWKKYDLESQIVNMTGGELQIIYQYADATVQQILHDEPDTADKIISAISGLVGKIVNTDSEKTEVDDVLNSKEELLSMLDRVQDVLGMADVGMAEAVTK